MCACTIRFVCLIKFFLSRCIVAAQQPLQLLKARGMAGVSVQQLGRAWKIARIEQLSDRVTQPHNENLIQKGNNIEVEDEEQTKYTHTHEAHGPPK